MFFITYLVHFLVAIFCFLTKIIGLLEVKGQKHLKEACCLGGGVIVVSNHPSRLETIILPALVFTQSKKLPWVTPFKTYYDAWYGFCFRARAIRIPSSTSVVDMVTVMRKGEVFIIFPEGRIVKQRKGRLCLAEFGRTFAVVARRVKSNKKKVCILPTRVTFGDMKIVVEFLPLMKVFEIEKKDFEFLPKLLHKKIKGG